MDHKDYAQSVASTALFASNFLFWVEAGYFERAAEFKPLIHTWSLSVEEQFYVLFPVFLILAWRFEKHRVFWMIVMMSLLSLLLSEWVLRKDVNANFFFLRLAHGSFLLAP